MHPDWTISELLERLADDENWYDEEYETLALIEAAAGTAAGAPPWTGTPGAVALVRSLDALRRTLPALGSVRLGELIAPGTAAHVAAQPTGAERKRLQLAIS